MKILKFIIALFVMALSCTSCLESNLEELKTYEGNDITSGYARYALLQADDVPDPGHPPGGTGGSDDGLA